MLTTPAWCDEVAAEFAPEKQIAIIQSQNSQTTTKVWHSFFAEKVQKSMVRDFFFANDSNFFAELNRVSPDGHEPTPGNSLVMLVVGNSYLLSALPLLRQKSGGNIILLCDKNPNVIRFMQYMQTTFLESRTEAEFQERLFVASNPAFEHITEGFIQKCYQWEKATVGSYHFSRDQESFEKCQDALRKTIFVPVCIDLFDSVQAGKLASLIKGKVALFNLTNVREWDGHDNLSTTLKLLPVVDKPIILSSSFRETFGMMNPAEPYPATRAMVCSIDDFNKTYLERLLLHVFVRYAANDLKLAQEVLQGVNHINTPGLGGYTPIEVAALQFQDKNLIRLLLKYGAKITANLTGKLEPEIRKYFRIIYTCHSPDMISIVDLSDIENLITEVEQVIKESLATKGLQVQEGTVVNYKSVGETKEKGYYFSEIGENALVFAEGNTHVGRLRKNASIIVTNGNLTVDNAEEQTHLQTIVGNILVQSLEGVYVRIISANDVELAQDYTKEIHVIAGGSIKARNIGAYSAILAKQSIQAGDVATDALLLAGGKIHVNNTNYGVCLATSNADIEIDYDPPHGGTLSIHNSGTVRYHLLGSKVSGCAVSLNTDGGIVDHSTQNFCYIRTGKFQEEKGSLDVNQHGSKIYNFAFQWLTWLKQRPIYKNAAREAATPQQLYISILKILDYTPVSFLRTFPQPSVTTLVRGLSWKICNVDEFFNDVVVRAIKESQESVPTQPKDSVRAYSELTKQWPAANKLLESECSAVSNCEVTQQP